MLYRLPATLGPQDQALFLTWQHYGTKGGMATVVGSVGTRGIYSKIIHIAINGRGVGVENSHCNIIAGPLDWKLFVRGEGGIFVSPTTNHNCRQSYLVP